VNLKGRASNFIVYYFCYNLYIVCL